MVDAHGAQAAAGTAADANQQQQAQPAQLVPGSWQHRLCELANRVKIGLVQQGEVLPIGGQWKIAHVLRSGALTGADGLLLWSGAPLRGRGMVVLVPCHRC
jgi:hypothetical protein